MSVYRRMQQAEGANRHAARSDCESLPGRSTWQGFTLIEMIGVLSILAVLASVAAPSFIKRIDRAALTREVADLATIKDSLLLDVRQTKSIPSAGTWVTAVARKSTLPPVGITTTPRGLTRSVMLDTSGWLGTVTLPYVQDTPGVATRPASARMMILSTIARPALPSLSASDFATIWSTANGVKPSALSSWGGKGEDLCIERVDLSSLFRKLVLLNLDPTWSAPYAIETNSYVSLSTGSGATGYFLDGTIVTFYRTNGVIQSREILQQDSSFVFVNGKWGRTFVNPNDDSGDFASLVAAFLLPPAPPSPDFAATQQAVINLFYSYMWGYADWSYGAPPSIPPFQGTGTSSAPQYPYFSVVSASQTDLANFIKNLIY